MGWDGIGGGGCVSCNFELNSAKFIHGFHYCLSYFNQRMAGILSSAGSFCFRIKFWMWMA